MSLTGSVKKLRIYTGSDACIGKTPMYRAILEKARSLDIAGGTAFKALDGYGANTRVLKKHQRFIDLSSDEPIVVEIIDAEENLLKLADFLKQHVKQGLATIEDVKILAYGAHNEKDI